MSIDPILDAICELDGRPRTRRAESQVVVSRHRAFWPPEEVSQKPGTSRMTDLATPPTAGSAGRVVIPCAFISLGVNASSQAAPNLASTTPPLDTLEPHAMLLFVRRRFDPSSSPSASLAAVVYSLGEVVGNSAQY